MINVMDIYETVPEYTATVEDVDGTVTVEVATLGGGTLGNSYENNSWIVNVWEGRTLRFSSSQIHTYFSANHYVIATTALDMLMSTDELDDYNLESFVSDRYGTIEELICKVFEEEHKAGLDGHMCDPIACDM